MSDVKVETKQRLVRPMRPNSPDVNCPICLGELSDMSVTNSCFHRFCFECLKEWSKIKAECPLCKQRFTSILHNIRAMDDYVEFPIVPCFREPCIDFRSRFPTIATSFHSIELMIPSLDIIWPQDFRRIHTSRYRTRSAGNQAAMEARHNIYARGLWVRTPANQDRIRESSPAFYRANPAATHRLVPWLKRELGAIGGSISTSTDANILCQQIMDKINIYPITSPQFRNFITRYLGIRADHFIHEFHHFAISPYDMTAYDDYAQYITPAASSLPAVEANSDDSDIEYVDPPSISLPFRWPAMAPTSNLASSSSSSTGSTSVVSFSSPFSFPIVDPSYGGSSSSIEPIEISSDSSDEMDHVQILDSHLSESDVEIINVVPPRDQRFHEIIEVNSSSDVEPSLEVVNTSKPPIPKASSCTSQTPAPIVANDQPTTSTGRACSRMSTGGRNWILARRIAAARHSTSSSSSDDLSEEDWNPQRRIKKRKRKTYKLKKRLRSSSSSSSDGKRKSLSKSPSRARSPSPVCHSDSGPSDPPQVPAPPTPVARLRSVVHRVERNSSVATSCP